MTYVWIGALVAVKKQEPKRTFALSMFYGVTDQLPESIADEYDEIEWAVKATQENENMKTENPVYVVLSGKEPKLFKNQFLTWRQSDGRDGNFFGTSATDALQIILASKSKCFSTVHNQFN